MHHSLLTVAASLSAVSIFALDNGLGMTPPMGWSSWNALAGNPTEDAIRAIADVMNSSGLVSLGYQYVNVDCGWSLPERAADGSLQVNPTRFPSGMPALSAYVRSKGLKLGIYSEHYTADCCGGPGMYGHYAQDAATFLSYGVEYLKVDSCAGHLLNASQNWADYAAVRDALNATGQPIYLSICPTSPNPPNIEPLCNPWGANLSYSPWFWTNGTDPTHTDPGALANSILVEYCNAANDFNVVTQIVDAQHDLVSDPAISRPGTWLDNDMLTVGCSDAPDGGQTPCAAGPGGGLSVAEERSMFSLWCIFASPLILGSDLRYMSNQTLSIISNAEVIAVDQDPLGYRGRLVYDGGAGAGEGEVDGPRLLTAPCDGSASQQWQVRPDGSVYNAAKDQCLDVWDCETANNTVVDLYECHVSTPACGGTNSSLNQQFTFSGSLTTGAPGTLTSALGPPNTLCVEVRAWMGVQVGLWPCGSGYQDWAYNATSQALQFIHTGYCLSTDNTPHAQQIYAKKMADGSRAVALFNRGAADVNMTVTWAQIALGETPYASADVRDLWAHAVVATGAPVGYTALVPSHDTVMLRVTPASASAAVASAASAGTAADRR